MRPPKGIIEAAIRTAEGNLTRTAGLLGCSRETLYRWIYQLDLQVFAGVTPAEGSDRHDSRARHDELTRKNTFPGVSSANGGPASLRLVSSSSQAREFMVSATIKVGEQLWKRVRKHAIDRGCTTSAVAERALVALLEDETSTKQAKEAK